jgi:HK97 family phage portal protein
VTVEGSLQASAVFACVRVLSETVASLPLVLYRRLERGKARATDHPLYELLHDLPNPEMTAFELRETLMAHAALWGNAFCEIEFDNAGRVRGLWPLRTDMMRVIRRAGRLWYVYKLPTGTDVELPFERVMHLRGLSTDGVVGYSPIDLARQSVGLALGTEEFGARFFGNGATTGTIYEHPGKLSQEAYDRLKDSIEKRHQGLERAHRIMILEEGMKASQVGIPPDNAQFLETRKFQVEEIARWYRMPLHKIQSLDRSTFSNIEHQSIEFVTDTIQPWCVRWEQCITRDLLTEREREEYFAEHLVDALLRGDTLSRYQAYAVARQNGWLSANDIREKENMNPVEGGDVYLVPLNMIPAEQVAGSQGSGTQDSGNQDAGERDSRESGNGREEQRSLDVEKRARVENLVKGRQRIKRSYERLINEAAGRVIRREVADVRRAIGKYLTKRDAFQFAEWLKQFYAEHRAFWIRQMLPILLSYADQVGMSVADELGGEPKTAEDIRQFLGTYADSLSKREAGSSQLQLQALLDEALADGIDPEPVLTRRLDEWEEKRAGKTTMYETVAMMGACSVAFYKLYGVVRKRWVSVGQSCPYCDGLDGIVVALEKFFLDANTDYQPEGAEGPLNSSYDVGHAPAHAGCDCLVMADV